MIVASFATTQICYCSTKTTIGNKCTNEWVCLCSNKISLIKSGNRSELTCGPQFANPWEKKFSFKHKITLALRVNNCLSEKMDFELIFEGEREPPQFLQPTSLWTSDDNWNKKWFTLLLLESERFKWQST